MIAGRDSRYRGTQGTSICKIFEGAIGQTGPSEKVLRQLGETDFEKLYLYPNSHAGYYPGAKMMAIKVLFRKSDGRLLGAQVLAEDGVAKRIDAFAMAIQMKATVYDLEEAELCYAPPFGSAKDPVNFAGMVAGEPPPRRHADRPLGRHREGRSSSTCATPRSSRSSPSPARVNIPLPQLRARLGELPRDKEIQVICRSAVRAYYATRILLQNGFKARNISGGMLSRSHRAVERTEAGDGRDPWISEALRGAAPRPAERAAELPPGGHAHGGHPHGLCEPTGEMPARGGRRSWGPSSGTRPSGGGCSGSAVKDIGRVFIVAIVLDTVYQLIVFHWVYPGQVLTVAVVCAIVPYVLVRGPITRIARLLHRKWAESRHGA